MFNNEDVLITRIRNAVRSNNERKVLLALLDTPMSLSLADKLVSGRYLHPLTEKTRKQIERGLKNLNKVS